MNKLLEEAEKIVWGPGMLTLLLGTGMYLMLRLHFLPLRRLLFAFRCAFCGDGRDNKTEGISPYASLMTELAATIGTGNIVGVTTAMALGGPGAVFWMVTASLLGMAVKLVESLLSVKYRTTNSLGEPVGGPMYTLRGCALHRGVGGMLGKAFALFAVLASFGMGNMTQSNSIAESLLVSFGISNEKTGLAVTILTILVVLGGIGVISKVTQVVVPFMGIFYLIGCLAVIGVHLDRIPETLTAMTVGAFVPQAVTGGLFGSVTAHMTDAIRFGVSRGVFSNEAGLGAAGISAAATGTKEYVKQGYISMTGVFLDTCVICFVTALALGCSGVMAFPGAADMGTGLTVKAFESVLGKWGGSFVSVCIVLFAFATIVGWAYQGERAFEFLFGVRSRTLYRFLYGFTAYAGAVCSLKAVWSFADICNALMAVPNLICVLYLSGEACRDLLAYDRRNFR